MTTTEITVKPMTEKEQRTQFVNTVAGWLQESDGKVKAQIYMIVKTAGAARTMDLLREVLAIEEAGGLLTADKSHRRTVGGVFFYLAKRKGYQPFQSWPDRRAKRKSRLHAVKDRSVSPVATPERKTA